MKGKKTCFIRVDLEPRSRAWVAHTEDEPELLIVSRDKTKLMESLREAVPAKYEFLSVGFHEHGIAVACAGLLR